MMIFKLPIAVLFHRVQQAIRISAQMDASNTFDTPSTPIGRIFVTPYVHNPVVLDKHLGGTMPGADNADAGNRCGPSDLIDDLARIFWVHLSTLSSSVSPLPVCPWSMSILADRLNGSNRHNRLNPPMQPVTDFCQIQACTIKGKVDFSVVMSVSFFQFCACHRFSVMHG